jgi:hypothetical protein
MRDDLSRPIKPDPVNGCCMKCAFNEGEHAPHCPLWREEFWKDLGRPADEESQAL